MSVLAKTRVLDQSDCRVPSSNQQARACVRPSTNIFACTLKAGLVTVNHFPITGGMLMTPGKKSNHGPRSLFYYTEKPGLRLEGLRELEGDSIVARIRTACNITS